MRDDVRTLVIRILDETRADEAVCLAESADEHLRREAGRRGGQAEFAYHLLTHKVSSTKARTEAIIEVARARRSAGVSAGNPGPSVVEPLSTR